MRQGDRGLGVDLSTSDANKTGERTTTRRIPIVGYTTHAVTIMTNMQCQDSATRERLETAAIVMQKWFCGGKVDKSVGIYQSMENHRLEGFAQFKWDAERSLGSMPENHKHLAPLFCSVYNVSAFYVSLCNKHGMFPMDPSTLCMGLCRWFESICGEYLHHIFGTRQHRDMSRTLEICKCIAAAETTINYSLLYSLKSKTYSEASPRTMMASMMDPIHIHEVPRLFFNFLVNNICLPAFFIISIFQREMEVPALPLESVLELLDNGKMCLCCVQSGRLEDPSRRCHLPNSTCHTQKVRKFLNRMVERRAFLPKESGLALHMDSNITQFITAYGGDDDRCNMSQHATFAASRSAGIGSSSCMRIKSSRNFCGSNANSFNFDRDGPSSSNADQDQNASTSSNNNVQQTAISAECFRLFVRESFVHYKQQLAGHAFIRDNELLYAVHEMATSMTTKFARFFGNLPFLGKYKTVMQNLGVHHVPSGMPNLSAKQVFQQQQGGGQGSPIITARCFISGELAIGIDWMMMLLMLGMSGSARIDQQLGKDIAKNLVAHVFNEVPYAMYPYNHLQLKEFNPYTPRQEVVELKEPYMRAGCLLRPENMCLINPLVQLGAAEKYMVPASSVWKEVMMEDMGFAAPLLDLCKKLSIKQLYNLPIHLVEWQIPYPTDVMYPVIQYGRLPSAPATRKRLEGCLFVHPGGKCDLWINGKNGNAPHKLNHVSEVASKHHMGPRPLFSRPGIAVLVRCPFNKEQQPSETSESETSVIGMLLARDDLMTCEDPSQIHALHRLCKCSAALDDDEAEDNNPKTFVYSMQYTAHVHERNEEEQQTAMVEQVDQNWVEQHVLAIGTRVWIKMWRESTKDLFKHIPWKNAAQRTGISRWEDLKSNPKAVYVCGVLSPPRLAADYSNKGVWVSIEVRHTMMGSLKNVPFTDMITLCLPPGDLAWLEDKRNASSVPNSSAEGITSTDTSSTDAPPPKKGKQAAHSNGSSCLASSEQQQHQKIIFQYLAAEAGR